MSTLPELVRRENELEEKLVESGGEITDIIAQIEDDLRECPHRIHNRTFLILLYLRKIRSENHAHRAQSHTLLLQNTLYHPKASLARIQVLFLS